MWLGWCLGCGLQLPLEILMSAFEKQPDIAHGLCVGLLGHQTFDARPVASVDVEFSMMRVFTRQIHIAGRDFEVSMDEVHQPVRQIAWKVRAKIAGAVFF